MSKYRIKWIDCAKAIAIIAVVVDHCNGLLYNKPLIAYASTFSVSLFVLLSGVSTAIASENNKKTISAQLKKVKKMFGQYAVATLITMIFYYHYVDFQGYITHLVNFNAQTPYYFFAFFLQLVLIAPFLLSWYDFCNNLKLKNMWHFISIVGLGFLASIFIRYTNIFSIFGGGRYLFGGTYILLYYLGIFLEKSVFFNMAKKRRQILFCILGPLWIAYLLLFSEGKLPFDRYMAHFWGESGINPPGMQLILFSLITLFLVYVSFSLLEECKGTIFRKTVALFSFIGRYTLYIFMYHLLVKDFIIANFKILYVNKWILRICVFIPMILIPIICIQIYERIKLYYLKCIGKFD